MPDLPTQSAADNEPELEEWQRRGYKSELAWQEQQVYLEMNRRSKERAKRRQELYELGYLSAEQLHYNR